MLKRVIIAVLLSGLFAAAAAASSERLVPVADPGWTWTAAVTYDNSALSPSACMACGPESAGSYSTSGTGFVVLGLTGPYASVGGHRRRMGKIRLSIDGQVKTEVSMSHTSFDADVNVTSVTGLPAGKHDIKIEALDGWVIVSGVKVVNDAAADKTPADDPSQAVALGDIPPGVYRLVPITAPLLTLDVKDFKTDDGTGIQLWTGNTSVAQNNQWFHVTRVSHGHYQVCPIADTGELLSIMPGSTTNRATHIWRDVKNDAQVWLLNPQEGGSWRLIPASDPTYALTSAGGTSNGVGVDSEPWAGYPTQLWRITDQMPR